VGRRPTMVRVIALIMGLIGVCCVTVPVAQQTRYVAPGTTAGIEFKGYVVWTNKGWAASCTKAILSGTKKAQEEFCETGLAGFKPKVGMVTVGTVVEVLDSRQCGDMAYIRVLTGPLKGETGCISASGLSSVRP
jgi:hypothetical protein